MCVRVRTCTHVFMTPGNVSGLAAAEPRHPQSWSVAVVSQYPAELFTVDFLLSSFNAA